MLWLLLILNALWFIFKIFILTSMWVSVEHNYEFFLIRTLCRVLNITSRFGCVMIRYLIYFWTYVSCLIIMIFAYSLIGHISLVETISQILRGVETSLLEKCADEKKLEWMFLVIMSRHLVRLRIASLHRAGIQTFEFIKRFSLIGFILEGYLCGFWRVVYAACFFIDFVELMKLLCRVCRAINDGFEYRYKKLFRTCLVCSGFCWTYMFLYKLPAHFVHNLFYFEDSEKTGIIPLFLFRINFLALVILSAIDFPFGLSYPYISIDTVDEIVNLGERPPKGPVVIPFLNRAEYLERTVRKRVPNTRASNIHIEGKAYNEKMEQRAAVGQIIRCIVTLKRKAKQIRDKKEKRIQQTIKANGRNDEKD